MYFLTQLRQQFFRSIYLSAGPEGPGEQEEPKVKSIEGKNTSAKDVGEKANAVSTGLDAAVDTELARGLLDEADAGEVSDAGKVGRINNQAGEKAPEGKNETASTPDEILRARGELGENATPEEVVDHIAEQRLVGTLSEKYDMDPEVINAIKAIGIEGADEWTPEETQEKLEDMIVTVKGLVGEGEELPDDIEEIVALYEASIDNDPSTVETVTEEEANKDLGLNVVEDANGNPSIDPETPGYSRVGNAVVGAPGQPYSYNGQIYRGQPLGTVSNAVNANLDASYSGLKQNEVNPMSPDQEAQLNNPENKELIEKRIPAEWHGSAIKLENKLSGNINPNKVIALASMTEKRAVVCYPDGKVDEFPIIIGKGGYREGAHKGGATTPTYEVYNFNGGKVPGRGMDASKGGSKTVLGAAAYCPEGQVSGGKWWHGVADHRIPGGGTLGCIGGKQENMMMMTRAILESGGYGYHTNSKQG